MTLILFSSVIVMDAFFISPWGAEIELEKKWLFERSFHCFLQFLKFGLWAIGIVIFNCLPKMEI